MFQWKMEAFQSFDYYLAVVESSKEGLEFQRVVILRVHFGLHWVEKKVLFRYEIEE